jgi:5-methylcytosine-specific restriction endonuclease McrA
MKEEILKLRSEGKSYREIQKTLGCSKGTIAYHCGAGQKEKTTKRRQKRRENLIIRKTDTFKQVNYEKPKKPKKVVRNRKDVLEGIRKYQKSDTSISHRVNKDLEVSFTWEDVVGKFGEETYCYLSGEPINLWVNNYQFDHIIPVSREGDNTLDNLGITHETVNYMKGNLTPDELIEWCIKIVEHNGYLVTKNTDVAQR